VNELKNQKEATAQTIAELREENSKLDVKISTISQDLQSRCRFYFKRFYFVADARGNLARL
jgi:hypothetical protein